MHFFRIFTAQAVMGSFQRLAVVSTASSARRSNGQEIEKEKKRYPAATANEPRPLAREAGTTALPQRLIAATNYGHYIYSHVTSKMQLFTDNKKLDSLRILVSILVPAKAPS